MKISTTLHAAMWPILASLVLAGCASKPVDELKMAGVAMDSANSVEAADYAPHEWNRAQAQWEEANALIHMERYSEAKNVLIESIASYNEAQAVAKRRVENLQIEIKALQSSAETELNKIEKVCESSKVKPSIRDRIEAAIPRLDEKISAMNSAFDAKEYTMAEIEGHEAVRYMTDLQKRLGISQ